MAIGPERMAYMLKMLRGSIASYYGESVPDIATFKNRRRKTFMVLLEEKVKASSWREVISGYVQTRGTKQGVVTRLNNEQQSKSAELNARHQQELEELKARHARERAELVAHYEPALLEAKEALSVAEKELSDVKRQSYFAGLEAEDDGRRLYGENDIDSAIASRVDDYIDKNLDNDDEGKAVQLRIHQENIVGDLAYIAEKISDLRAMVIAFIASGKLPPITVEAWLIEDGKDLLAQ